MFNSEKSGIFGLEALDGFGRKAAKEREGIEGA